jgi:hypothetical protein
MKTAFLLVAATLVAALFIAITLGNCIAASALGRLV